MRGWHGVTAAVAAVLFVLSGVGQAWALEAEVGTTPTDDAQGTSGNVPQANISGIVGSDAFNAGTKVNGRASFRLTYRY